MNRVVLFRFILFFIFLIPTISWSQSITGKIVDEENNPLEFATIAILNPQDSILISYASTDQLGKFELVKISEGTRMFQANLIGFRPYQKFFEYHNESIDFGTITFESDNQLDEVIITAVVPISIKTDTVAYNAKAFKIGTGDNVEDLLKKLPGVEVDESGKVTAQGEAITKIYVDGKEFFSGDPAIATKNLPADAIKSIEVIDEKSEKSRISGIDDSQPIKVINLILKEDKKVNDFGKFQGGYGTDDRYLTSVSYNRFSSKIQTSVIGKYNNINTSGSDISEIILFNGGGNAGFLTTGVGGFNLGYELGKDKNLNANYFYNYSNRTSGEVIRNRTEFIDDLEIRSESKNKSENTSNSNKVDFNYRERSKRLSSLTIRGRVNVSDNEGSGLSSLDKYNGQGELDLQSIGNSYSTSDNSSGRVYFEYGRRFKEGSKRHLYAFGAVGGSKSKSTSNNNQFNQFNISDPNNAFDSKQEIVKEQDNKSNQVEFSLEYIEPIVENHYIEIEGEVSHDTNDNDVNQSRYENDVIQNPLIYNEFYNGTDLIGKVGYKYSDEKLTLSTGVQLAEQTQDFGLENDIDIKNVYTNFNPQLNIRYKPKKGESLRFNMRKSVRLPGFSQISPVINDFNPLFIHQGNPDLTPEDKYSANGRYGKHNFATGFSVYARLSYNYSKNSIGKSEFTDPLGVRYSSYENLGDKNNVSSSVYFGKRMSSLGLRYGVRVKGGYSEYFSMINSIINETQSKNGTLGLSLENNKKEVVDASVSASWKKNYTTFTSGNNADRDYFQQTYFSKVDWNVTDRFNVNSQLKYDIYTDSNFGTDQAVPIWNGTMSYALTEAKSMTVMISALDILNKNIGLERNSSDNYFEEVQRDVLGNYYMLSLTYNLNGNKSSKKKG